jgi:BirA family transcriptional regulator, biotin operon repressor / biotin---[acetyl-CoA-carboxylase] ligase
MADSIPGGLTAPPLLVLLSDGEVRSGESLAEQLGQTRAAVWKGVERLRALGIGVQALARRGYRLTEPIELLQADRVLRELSAPSRRRLRNLEILFEVDSTSTRLLAAAKPPPIGVADACTSELQHAGRGRLGRRWIAPFGSGLAISLAWSFSDAARALPALSLGVGVAVSRALVRAGAAGIALKWPNDIWYHDRKVGGVLLEIRAEAGGPGQVVIGVGINVRLPAAARQEIEASGARVAAVADACNTLPSRNQIAGTLLDELLSMLVEFERVGFPAYRDEWTALDALNGRPVQVQLGDRNVTGTARGADLDGALLLEVDGSLQRFVSGEASLRLIEGDN